MSFFKTLISRKATSETPASTQTFSAKVKGLFTKSPVTVQQLESKTAAPISSAYPSYVGQAVMSVGSWGELNACQGSVLFSVSASTVLISTSSTATSSKGANAVAFSSLPTPPTTPSFPAQKRALAVFPTSASKYSSIPTPPATPSPVSHTFYNALPTPPSTPIVSTPSAPAEEREDAYTAWEQQFRFNMGLPVKESILEELRSWQEYPEDYSYESLIKRIAETPLAEVFSLPSWAQKHWHETTSAIASSKSALTITEPFYTNALPTPPSTPVTAAADEREDGFEAWQRSMGLPVKEAEEPFRSWTEHPEDYSYDSIVKRVADTPFSELASLPSWAQKAWREMDQGIFVF